MNDKPQLQTVTNLCLVLATVVWGVFSLRERSGSPRPAATSMALQQSRRGNDERVQSRLWQDPFEPFATNRAPAGQGAWTLSLGPQVVARLAPAKDTNPPAAPLPLREEICRRAATGRVAVLGVMLEGGPYEENKEVRRRLRYAVQLALTSSDLIGPADRTHLYTNLVTLPLAAKGTQHFASALAWEWFAPDTPTNVSACVVWLNEDDFSSQPLFRLQALVANLMPQDAKASFYLIGPRSSDTLRALVSDAPAPAALTNLAALAKSGRFQILSPEVTAADDWLLRDKPADTARREQIQARLAGLLTLTDASPPVFRNWIATDTELATLVARELANRVAPPVASSNNVVALITEQDTLYGRTLAGALTAALKNEPCCGERTNVWRYTYLRGLDGSKPQREMPSENPPVIPSTPEAALQSALARQQKGETADGDSQLDYVMRLAMFLQQRDAELRRENRRIMAVGLAGSDAYDKLILLRALRHRLSEAVFFTTDLDARLWTKEELKYTRNVVVASAYSLNPAPAKPHWSEQFPPFRDVYQTALFRTCRAVILHEGDPANSLDATADDLAGHLYAIGRRGPIPLTLPASNSKRVPPDRPTLAQSLAGWLQPAAVGTIYGFIVVLVVGTLRGGFQLRGKPAGVGAVPACIAVWRNPPAPSYEGNHAMGCPRSCLVGGAVAGCLFGLAARFAYGVAHMDGEEPWDMRGGLSIWPSEGLRLLVVAGSAVFLIWAYHYYLQQLRKLARDYFDVTVRLRDRVDWRGVWRWLTTIKSSRPWRRRVQPRVSINRWRAPMIGRLPHEVSARRLFIGYLRRGSLISRCRRVLPIAAGYVACGILWLKLTDGFPTRLCVRGPLSHAVDLVLLFLAIASFLFVLFYVLDAARLTCRFLECVNDGPTHWPPRLLLQRAATQGVQSQHLAGWLDVELAATKTADTSRLMFAPISLCLLLLLSRSQIIHAWTWPAGLAAVFAVNFGAAGICWWLVRRSAERLRKGALERLDDSIREVENDASDVFPIPNLSKGAVLLSKQMYLRRLRALRHETLAEQHGAYAPWFQDPTYFAVFIPTGFAGVFSVIFQIWFNQ